MTISNGDPLPKQMIDTRTENEYEFKRRSTTETTKKPNQMMQKTTKKLPSQMIQKKKRKLKIEKKKTNSNGNQLPIHMIHKQLETKSNSNVNPLPIQNTKAEFLWQFTNN